MKLGDVIESAIWVTGDESVEMIAHHESQIQHCLGRLCQQERCCHGPVTFIEKRPGEDRVPEVPDHVQGQRVRLLVAETTIVEILPETSRGSFIANLDKKDLIRLRYLTRRGAKATLTDWQCDAIIEEIGPQAALDTLKDEVDRGLLH